MDSDTQGFAKFCLSSNQCVQQKICQVSQFQQLSSHFNCILTDTCTLNKLLLVGASVGLQGSHFETLPLPPALSLLLCAGVVFQLQQDHYPPGLRPDGAAVSGPCLEVSEGEMPGHVQDPRTVCLVPQVSFQP